MLYWLREIAGWGLVLGALYLVRIALQFAMNLESPKIVEAGVITVAAMGLLRAGIMLIRISTAARLCRFEPPAKQS